MKSNISPIHTYKKTITKNLYLYPLDKSLAVDIDGKKFYICKDEWAKVEDKDDFDAFESIFKVKRFELYPEEVIKEMQTVPITHIKNRPERIAGNWFLTDDPEEIKEIESRMFHFSYYDHSFYALGNPLPHPAIYKKDYIGGIVNGRFDLNKALKILNDLKPSGVITEVRKVIIPSYNRSPGCTEAIEFNFKLTPEMIKAALLVSDEHSKIRDVVPLDYTSFDPFGLRDAMRSKKEREAFENMEDEDDDEL